MFCTNALCAEDAILWEKSSLFHNSSPFSLKTTLLCLNLARNRFKPFSKSLGARVKHKSRFLEFENSEFCPVNFAIWPPKCL